ncbi:AC4 [Tobacco leaf curl Dominican Republic virus]|uniref:AC4 n=1 Tax=Tobacco leaf curl Dominican Republic virus TaxID=2528965 RepID=A0A481UKH0_9GEMI|nr:AC4 [Tobacco leaf curl Dominican Republic virus]QBI71945.1 AC4 [Tobacco leaf curl Dominican Republic virus]
MGNLTSMCFSSSRGNSTARIADSSTWFHQPGQYITIPTFREPNQAPTSSPTSRRTEIHWNGEDFRSTVDLLEEAARHLTTHTPRH